MKKSKRRSKRNARVDYKEDQNKEDKAAEDIKILHALVGSGISDFVQEMDAFLELVDVKKSTAILLQVFIFNWGFIY